MQLSIIIVNYKTPELTHRCIHSIVQSMTNITFEIIVIDNASNDHSEEYITKDFPQVQWINNSYNAGFGRANNLGVAHAKGKYILLLNSDMLLLEDEDFQTCIDKLEESENNGILGCKLLNEDNSFQKSFYHDIGSIHYLLSYNVLWYKLFKPKPRSLDAIMGSFMLFRKTDFDTVQGFDEDFFMYAEELELCNRIKKQEKNIIYFENYSAIHKHGGSSDNSNWAQRQNALSTALLYLKIGGWSRYVAYHFIYHFNVITNSLLFFHLSQKERNIYKNMYKAYFYNYFTYIWLPFYYSFKKNKKTLKTSL